MRPPRLSTHATVIESPQSLASSIAERWYVVIVMCLVYAVSIADRYVVSTVLEPIRLDLQLTDAGAGFLTGVPLGLFYVSLGIPMSWLADRKNRRNILAASMIVWSGFTALCGLSRSYWQFLAGRIGVGIGETGGTPPANSIIADYFPADRRPMALGVFALGAPIGAWLGADMAGAVAHAYGWRAAFLALGIPGVIMGTVVYLTRASVSPCAMDAWMPCPTPPRRPSSSRCASLWRQKAAFHVVMASGVCALWGWGLIWFTPTFLMRSYHLNVGEAGAVTGHIHLVGGIIATAGTAWILSRPAMADPRRVVWLLAVGVGLTTIPSFIAYWTHSLWIAKTMFWLFIPAIYFYIGPCMGLMQNLAPSRMRAMFTAWSLVVGNVFNLIIAPQGVGLLSDWFAGSHGADAHSLRLALLVLAPTGFWAVYHFLMASRTIVAEQKRAIGYVTSQELVQPLEGDPVRQTCLKTLIFIAACAAGMACPADSGIKVLNDDAHYPEGPIWYHGKLYYVEYDRNAVMVWDGHKNSVFAAEKGCGQSAVVPAAHGEFLTTCYDNGSIGRMSADGKVLPAYTQDKDGNKFHGPNDFAPDGHGGIYFTASGTPPEARDGRVFYIAADGTISLKAGDLHNANGLAVSKDGKTLYVVETSEYRLVKFKIGPDASLSDRQLFVNLDELTKHVVHIYPDGVKIDSHGAIYIGQERARDPCAAGGRHLHRRRRRQAAARIDPPLAAGAEFRVQPR